MRQRTKVIQKPVAFELAALPFGSQVTLRSMAPITAPRWYEQVRFRADGSGRAIVPPGASIARNTTAYEVSRYPCLGVPAGSWHASPCGRCRNIAFR
jgi:hypothetical protein